MSANVLITGGAGFIGSNLCHSLIAKGYKVTVLDCLSSQIHGDDPENNSYLFLSIKGKVKFIRGCVTSRNTWLEAIEGQDAIIHLAAETGTGQSMYEIQRYSDVNIGGTALMLDLLANTKHNVKKVIVASSRSIYGEGKYLSEKYGIVYPEHRTDFFLEKGDFDVKYNDEDKQLQLLATDEGSKIHPSSVYGITKQTQEQMVMTVCASMGIASVAYRYQNVYGPGQSLSNPYTGILSIFSTLILNNKEINIFEDGKESRDFVYITDVVDATIMGLEKNSADGQVFNVGTGTPTDVLKVATLLIKNYQSNSNVTITGNYRLGDIRHNYADLTKISNLLGYIPKYDFETGIKLFTDWVLTQKVQPTKYEHSLQEMKAKGLFK
ncbi:MAG: NAD-dependent epimerase/dehydratase family protein [Filimonas sp.]|nr:NAD-dependent epimerase/dehydratase family protein [Filimonas sp.]